MKIKNLTPILLALALTACGSDSTESKKEEPKEETKVEETTKEETTEEETTEEEPAEEAKSEESESSEDFEIVEIAQDETSPMVKINGKIKNNSGKDLSYLQIEIPIYDADGAKLGTALANINDLKKDEVWKFEAISGVTEKGAKADLEKIEYSGF